MAKSSKNNFVSYRDTGIEISILLCLILYLDINLRSYNSHFRLFNIKELTYIPNQEAVFEKKQLFNSRNDYLNTRDPLEYPFSSILNFRRPREFFEFYKKKKKAEMENSDKMGV